MTENSTSEAQAREFLDVIHEISSSLNTGLSRDELALCIRIIQSGGDPVWLETILRDWKDETEGKLNVSAVLKALQGGGSQRTLLRACGRFQRDLQQLHAQRSITPSDLRLIKLQSAAAMDSENVDPKLSSSLNTSANQQSSTGHPSSSDVSSTHLKVRIKSWRAVAAWHWMANDDSCGICRMPFDACCSDCKLPGDDCPLVWGQCSHCFHIHCIMKWLNSQTQQQCPMCRQEWKFKE